MITPTLETKRLILRPLSVKDAEVIFEHWTHDERVAKYMNWNLHKTVEETREWLLMEEENCKNDINYTFAFVRKGTQELIGSGGINFNQDYGKFEVGYNIMFRYWNQGYTTEAIRTILDFAKNELGIHIFFARHAKANPASGKVMKKIGFQYQKDATYTSFDGTRSFESKEYLLEI